MARAKHNLSHHRLLTGDLGELLPCGLVEVLPGDIFNHSANAFIRLSPMAAPVMHPLTVRLHHFFVPTRLVWPDAHPSTYEEFFTGGPDGNDASTVPTMTSTGVAGDIMDHLGVPVVSGIEVNSLPVRAYNLIWNEWFRDQDLAAERGLEDTDVGAVAWEKTYETTARPWPQKGDEVSLPLGTSADVHTASFTGGVVGVYSEGQSEFRRLSDNGFGDQTVGGNTSGAETGKLFADLSTATAATVRDLRRALGIQRFQEARARWGHRYHEFVRQQFGAITPDARIQRPEYLGGGASNVSISEVLQTGPDSTDAGQGDLYGHGIGVTESNAYRTRFTEHGYCLTFISVRPKLMFSQGLDRLWLRQDKEDFYIRELEAIGAQQVLEQELYATAANAGNVFGFSDRYDEYRSQRSSISGEFRTLYDYWHLAQLYGAAPALNETFISCIPSKRIFNEQTQDSLLFAVQHRLAARRVVSQRAQVRIL